MSLFVSKYRELRVTWPVGSEQTIQFRHGKFSTDGRDDARHLDAHLRTLADVYEAPVGMAPPEPAKPVEGGSGSPAPMPRDPAEMMKFLARAKEAGVVTRNDKGWYLYGDKPVGDKGKVAIAFFDENAGIFDAIAAAMKQE